MSNDRKREISEQFKAAYSDLRVASKAAMAAPRWVQPTNKKHSSLNSSGNKYYMFVGP
ncbi:hypothetical protein ARSEF4850_008074 [Beauveria asiatica]